MRVGSKRLVEVGRGEQCLVYYEQKDISRIYKHPHSSFQREPLTGGISPISPPLYSMYNGSLAFPFFAVLLPFNYEF